MLIRNAIIIYSSFSSPKSINTNLTWIWHIRKLSLSINLKCFIFSPTQSKIWKRSALRRMHPSKCTSSLSIRKHNRKEQLGSCNYFSKIWWRQSVEKKISTNFFTCKKSHTGGVCKEALASLQVKAKWVRPKYLLTNHKAKYTYPTKITISVSLSLRSGSI